ncbi:hypothetical protein GJV85_04965 [Sulfurimonas aquatica]|uniref:Uncharacterized protein n=1 Tax=Sulfurimonas aquatica TaxID=2672570 RepID=A0A975GCG6_9BACT|nr:hypothetical protein [Sulfurimonas aquatica]QSZ41482.1 hypothetical protein GJV85_04965 [Sulfurimonas aquatica]
MLIYIDDREDEEFDDYDYENGQPGGTYGYDYGEEEVLEDYSNETENCFD